MSWLFASHTPSYANEQVLGHLSSLSTLPIQLSSSPSTSSSFDSRPAKPNPILQNALAELSSSRPISGDKLVDVLKSLVNVRERERDQNAVLYSVDSEVDRIVEMEVLARASTLVWGEVLKTLVDSACELEQERTWWTASLASRSGTMIYLVQTLPEKLYRSLPPPSSFSLRTLPSSSTLFRPLHASPSATAIVNFAASPYLLTRREMFSCSKALTVALDSIAEKVGFLAARGPGWNDSAPQLNDISSESGRLYSVLCDVLQVPPPPSPTPRRSRSSATSSSQPPQPTASPPALLAILTQHLPRTRSQIRKTLCENRRPGPLTRLWFPLLFLPPILYSTVSLIARNKEWMRQQVINAKETVRGFVVQWVWEPLEGIGKTLRGGGEGLGVAPTTVKADQESLERMVMDLGRDYYKLSGPQLEALGERVKAGDMEEVLRVYEKEMQSPIKNAVLGSLIRTLLIQVQKTKTDLSLSLLSLDHLLRSQQLTFAFVGVAPSVLVLYGLGGWLRAAWRGEQRGKGRKREYFNGVRDIERLLITSPKHEEAMSDRDRGLLIVGVSRMRTWAAGLGGGTKDAFLDDLRMVEDPVLSRGDKLRVMERVWRCWGTTGRRAF
ncbi:ATP synthase regulation protein NCA2-domain-containing protein [Naematelia encephala]|uniref:ATP synthase regulation protein NCA2-domain-containing protein n=1 Tax=Naematelia encephala TaxID=71784 RepID=A0A1Y2AF62_9TREE|nr:ATP synthase regulation protein NCA2-domain-containing protein [Naematelia encephala]